MTKVSYALAFQLLSCLQARLLPSFLQALWSMAELQYDPGEELMQAGARVLAGQAHTIAPQVRSFAAAACCLCANLLTCHHSSERCRYPPLACVVKHSSSYYSQ